MKRFLLIVLACLTIAGCGEAGEPNSGAASLYSPSFLIIDLNKNGMEFIPLEESQVYWDVNGDGKKEHTAWIKKGDALYLVFTREMDSQIQDIDDRIFHFAAGGLQTIFDQDRNGDLVYDETDRDILTREGGMQLLRAGFMEVLDDKGTTSRKGQRLGRRCEGPTAFKNVTDFKGEIISDIRVTGKAMLLCQNNSFPIYEVQFNYENSSGEK